MNVSPALATVIDLDLQVASDAPDLPAFDDLLLWAGTALAGRQVPASLTIRLVDDPEIRQLNHDYRGKDAPTNVLSFPFEAPPGIDDPDVQALLGDLIICAPLVTREAAEQAKPVRHHWAHLVIHGTLHLLGYDHLDPAEADVMEALERRLLAQLDMPDPYWPENHLPTGIPPL